MAKNLRLLLTMSALVALVCYIYYLNPATTTVSIKPGSTVEVPLAVLMLSLVLAGALSSAVIGVFVATRLRMQIWKLEKSLNKVETAEQEVRRARGLIRLENYADAIVLLKRLIDNQTVQHSARAMLVEALHKDGQDAEALAYLTSVRSAELADPELLLLGAELATAAGNHTIAYDNLLLVLQKDPHNVSALRAIVSAAEALHRLDDAISFQEQLIKQLRTESREHAQISLARLELQRAIAESKTADERIQAVDRVLQRHRNFGPALAVKAAAVLGAGNSDEAASLYVKSYHADGDTHSLIALVQLWLANNQPAKAIQVLEEICAKKHADRDHPDSFLLYGNLLLHLEMIDPAKQVIRGLKDKAALFAKYPDEVRILESRLCRRLSKIDQAFKLLEEVQSLPSVPGDTLFGNGTQTTNHLGVKGSVQPNPTLYTAA